MNLYAISLGFLAPAITYAVIILSRELHDPFQDFHDSYRHQKFLPNLSVLPAVSRLGTSSKDISLFGVSFSRRQIWLWILFSLFALLFFQSIVSIAIITVSALFIHFVTNQKIHRQKKIVRKQLTLELPSFVELFSIMISSGESPTSAIAKLNNLATGQIAHVLGDAVDLLHSGVGLTATLDSISGTSKVPELRRFCDSLIIAMQRGTSLSEVLSRQVVEIRTRNHARMTESAGKAEIALMIPVVFLVLPISVLFALWPSYVALGQSISF
jgi:Flp pilus assembly protein TadB